jgi:hypothetical protein
MDDVLYAGTQGPQPGDWSLYRIDASGNARNITPTETEVVELSGMGTIGVTKLYPFNGKLYVATQNIGRGFTFLRYSDMVQEATVPVDGNGWEVITLDGFGDPRNTAIWSMQEFQGMLYMGTFTQDFLFRLPDFFSRPENILEFDPALLAGSAQLWRSNDGLVWERETNPAAGFGIWDYGFRDMVVGNNGTQLFLGTASNLFAPDAMEIIGLLFSEQLLVSDIIPTFWGNILREMNPENFPAWFVEGLMPQAIGPGAEIWTLNPDIVEGVN